MVVCQRGKLFGHTGFLLSWMIMTLHLPVALFSQTSKYPIILSIENHCSVEQQDVMVQQLKEILGESLLSTTIDGRVPTQLPSPEVGKWSD